MSDWIFRSVYTFSTRLDSRLDIDSTRCVQCTTHSHIHMNIEPRLWLYDYRLLFLTNGASDTRMVYICILRYMYVNGWILIHVYMCGFSGVVIDTIVVLCHRHCCYCCCCWFCLSLPLRPPLLPHRCSTPLMPLISPIALFVFFITFISICKPLWFLYFENVYWRQHLKVSQYVHDYYAYTIWTHTHWWHNRHSLWSLCFSYFVFLSRVCVSFSLFSYEYFSMVYLFYLLYFNTSFVWKSIRMIP